MKNVKREMKRKGITLVELLIVIVVIGVLSAMMMLSSTEAVSSAKASDIVSDLRNMKTAALAWYADHLDIVEERVTPTSLTWGETGIAHATVRTDILKYMNNESADAKYQFVGKDTGKWFVYYDKPDTT
ncbi:MAG: type II secretion system protein, partial [Synergistaceae bacterium]|nr:type II secretion system protein [Synergistaceae bacterium]